MNRLRACGRRIFATLVVCVLGIPGPARAFRDCCFVRSVPPRLVGVSFQGPIDDVLDRLERAGFQDYDPGRRHIEGLGNLTDTAFPPPLPGSGGIGGQLLTPSVVSLEMACASSAPAIGLMPMGGHPNGARLLRGVIAVVNDLDGACKQLEGTGLWGRPRFGEAFVDPALGAKVRELHFAIGGLRVMAPIDSSGPVAHWLANGGPRWIGFTVEVGNLATAESWLMSRHVPFNREDSNAGLWIDPDDLDGLLVEFIPSGRF